MSLFTSIDPKLRIIADQLQAKLKIDREWDPTASFEERRIDWIQNGINKAIIIQPTFESTGVDSKRWNFYVFACITINGVARKPGWRKELVVKKDFSVIELEIDKLLKVAVKHLIEVEIEDVAKRKNT